MKKWTCLLLFFFSGIFFSSSIWGDELWGKFKKYNSKKQEVTLKNGFHFFVRGNYFQTFFNNLEEGDALKLELENKKIQSASKITSVELKLHYCSLGDIVSLQTGKNALVEGKIIQKTEEFLVLIPMIRGRFQRGMKTRIIISNISRFKNKNSFSRIPMLDSLPKMEKKKLAIKQAKGATKNPKKKKLKISIEDLNEDIDTSWSGTLRRFSREGPSFLAPFFRFGSNNPVLFFILLGFALWKGSEFAYKNFFQKKSSHSLGGVSGFENRKAKEEASQKIWIPSFIKIKIKKPSGGYDVQVKVFFKKVATQKERKWELLLFLQTDEKASEFRLSRSDLAIDQPSDSLNPFITGTMHIFSPMKEANFFPILVQPKEGERLKDFFLSQHLEISRIDAKSTYPKKYEALKEKLLAKKISLQEVPVELL